MESETVASAIHSASKSSQAERTKLVARALRLFEREVLSLATKGRNQGLLKGVLRVDGHLVSNGSISSIGEVSSKSVLAHYVHTSSHPIAAVVGSGAAIHQITIPARSWVAVPVGVGFTIQANTTTVLIGTLNAGDSLRQK